MRRLSPFSSHARHQWHDLLTNILQYGIMLLLILLPFHAFMVIVISHVTGHELALAAWKDAIVLILAAAGIGLALLDKNFGWLKHRTNYAILGAIASGMVASIINWHFDITWLVGIKTTLLPLVLFLTVQQVAKAFDDSILEKLVLLPALLVSVVALWQFLAIPTTLLSQLGYSAATIQPYQGVHPGFDFGRAFATLGGPNQLGAYLILPAVWLFLRAVKLDNRRERLASAIGFCIVAGAVVVSFSRSAILALLVGLVAALFSSIPKKWRWPLVGALAAAVLIGWFGVRTVLHYDPGTAARSFLLRGELSATGQVVGGDSGHVQAVEQGLEKVSEHPLGLGLGSAGPASFYGHQLLTENWFIQIALELGVIGLAFLIFAFARLFINFHRKSGIFTMAMFASLAGLLVANLFLHTFADSTLGLTYFALAGIALARPEEA